MSLATFDSDKFHKDVARLIKEVEDLIGSEDKIVKERLEDIKAGRVETLSEEELDNYLRKRGLNLEELED